MASKARALLQAAKKSDTIVEGAINRFNYHTKAATVAHGRELSEKLDRQLLAKIAEFILQDCEPYEKRVKETGMLYLSPSQFGDCQLQSMYRIFGIQETIPNHDIQHVGRMERIFKNGDMVHYRIAAYLSLMGYLEKREDKLLLPLTDNIFFTGRLDCTVMVPEEASWVYKNGTMVPQFQGEKRKFVIDVKSAKDRSFKEMVKAGAPSDSYRKQLEIYMRAENCPGILLVENKDTQEIKEFLVQKSNRVWKSITDEADQLYLMWSKNRLPQRDEQFNPDRFPCTYCSFSRFCWENEAVRLEEVKRIATERNAKHEVKEKSRKLALPKNFKLKLKGR